VLEFEQLKLLCLFLIFILIGKKALGFLKNALLIAILGFAFPFIARALNVNVELTLQSCVNFALLALSCYFIWVYLDVIWKISKSLSRLLDFILSWRKKKKLNKAIQA